VFIFVIFTHPVMQILARTKFFGGGHKLSGLDPDALGAVYHTRSQFRQVTPATGGRAAKSSRSRGEAERRQTIAERKRAEALAGDRSTDAGSEGER
jgi:preprotein translocase subunit SecD